MKFEDGNLCSFLKGFVGDESRRRKGGSSGLSATVCLSVGLGSTIMMVMGATPAFDTVANIIIL